MSSQLKTLVLGLVVVVLGAGAFFYIQSLPQGAGTEPPATTPTMEDDGEMMDDEMDADEPAATPRAPASDTATAPSESAPEEPATPSEPEEPATTGSVDTTLSELDNLFDEDFDDSNLDAFFDDSSLDSLTQSYDI